MLLLNYRTKIWKLNYNQSRAGWTENKERQQTEGIDSADKKICPDNFFVQTIILSGQKGIYHQVEFCPSVQGFHTGLSSLLFLRSGFCSSPWEYAFRPDSPS